MRSLISLLILVPCLCGCRQSPVAVPRRPAYARVATLDTARIDVPGAPARFSVSREAVISSPRDGWLDVTYPAYGAVANITFTPARGDELDAALANRLERMELNAGGLPGESSEWTNPAGFHIMTRRTERCATPWQFVASDGRGLLVSGAVRFADPRAVNATDSVAPMLDAIASDLTRALNLLQ